MKPVRTRFAPSPTGLLHVGGVRTALFAWLVARQAHGQFILRLEDTDKAREVEGSDQHIMDSLNWIGLPWDEGPDKPGPHGPYRQSERLNSYTEWGQKLVEQGRAYADVRSAKDLDDIRAQAVAQKRPVLFREYRPDNPPNWQAGMPLRFKSEPKSYSWHDEVMGDLHTGPEVVDDFILIKSDGFPTYNFAHVIDDQLMEITHVIRSQEFLASVPKYLNLYEALDFDRPKLATLPYVMGPDGKKKLSKRDGAKDVLDYRRQGFLPEALLNFMATLGWNDGTEQEIFTVDELVAKFQLDRVQKSGARFDEQRLIWLNGSHIRKLSLNQLYQKSKDYWPKPAEDYPEDYKKRVLALVQERLKYLAELPQLTNFFFEDLPVNKQLTINNKQLAALSPQELKSLLTQARMELEASDFSLEDLTSRLNDLLQTTDQKPAVLFSLIRIATTQAPASPGLAETLAVLGKETSLRRIDKTIKVL